MNSHRKFNPGLHGKRGNRLSDLVSFGADDTHKPHPRHSDVEERIKKIINSLKELGERIDRLAGRY